MSSLGAFWLWVLAADCLSSLGAFWPCVLAADCLSSLDDFWPCVLAADCLSSPGAFWPCVLAADCLSSLGEQGGETGEAPLWMLDVAGVEEVAQGTLDLEGSGMGRAGRKSGNRDGVGSLGDDCEEVLREELTMESVGTSLEQVSGLEGVGTLRWERSLGRDSLVGAGFGVRGLG